MPTEEKIFLNILITKGNDGKFEMQVDQKKKKTHTNQGSITKGAKLTTFADHFTEIPVIRKLRRTRTYALSINQQPDKADYHQTHTLAENDILVKELPKRKPHPHQY